MPDKVAWSVMAVPVGTEMAAPDDPPPEREVDTAVVVVEPGPAAQLGVVGLALVCLETIVGNPWVPIVGVFVKLRLLVSPVNPSSTHVGADTLLSDNFVCASRVVLAPKFAAPPLPSPKTSNSAVFQFGARSTTLSGLLTNVASPPNDRVTASLPPAEALPSSCVEARSAAVKTPPENEDAGLLV